MASSCGDGGELVLYGWGKNAPAVELPEGVGFSVGRGTGIQAVVLQVGNRVRRHATAAAAADSCRPGGGHR
jgi:hypothetical protein